MSLVGRRWSAGAILLGSGAILGLYAGCGAPDLATPWGAEEVPEIACVAPEDCPESSDKCKARGCAHNQCVYSSVVPNDQNSCTLDTCDPEIGVINTPLGPDAVDDGNPCTDDTCDPAIGKPVHTARPVPEDQNACTEDACDPKTGDPVYTTIDPDDGNACSVDSCDQETGPQNFVPTCETVDKICTFAVCDPADGVCKEKKQLFVEDFSSSMAGWTLDAEWQIGPTKASAGGDPANDHSLSDDNGIAGVVIGGNPSTAPHGPRYLTSPPIDLRSVHPDSSIHVSYWHVLNSTSNMVHTVEAFDGTDWAPIKPLIPSGETSEAGWIRFASDDLNDPSKPERYRIKDFQIRFGFSITADAAVAGSWNIDDVSIDPGSSCE